jgi:hypothetical protein
MAMITVQVKLPEETVQQIDSLRGPKLGWAQSAVVRSLVEEALRRRFFMPECSIDRTDGGPFEHPTPEPAAAK